MPRTDRLILSEIGADRGTDFENQRIRTVQQSFQNAFADAAHVEITARAQLQGDDGHPLRQAKEQARSIALYPLAGFQMQNRRD